MKEQVKCKYHAAKPARWRCNSCGINFCPACTRREFLPRETFFCPICREELASLGAANTIQPFWQRIPRFFAFPANPSSLIYIAILSILSTVTFSPSFLGGILQLVLFAVFLRYAYAVLSHTAAGHLTPPEVDLRMVNEGLHLPFKQLVVFIAMGVIAGLVGGLLGPAAGLVYILLMNLLLPASVMVLATEESIGKALNPLLLLSMVRRIGWSYLILCAFLLILWAGAGATMGLLAGHGSLAWGLLVVNFVMMYFLLIMFHMMGYVIYQHHDALGFRIDAEPDEAEAWASAPQRHPVLNEVEILLKEGRMDLAIERLKEAFERAPAELALREKLYQLAVATQDPQLILEQGPNLITALLAANQPRKAALVFRDCYQVDPQCRPSADQSHALASELAALREGKIALELMSGFAHRHPNHPDIPRLYFLAAKILSESFKQDRKATDILKSLLARYPAHPLAPDMQAYLGLLGKLNA